MAVGFHVQRDEIEIFHPPNVAFAGAVVHHLGVRRQRSILVQCHRVEFGLHRFGCETPQRIQQRMANQKMENGIDKKQKWKKEIKKRKRKKKKLIKIFLKN